MTSDNQQPQVGPEPPTPTPTPEPNGTSTGNSTGNATGDGGGFLSLDPQEWVLNALQGFAESLASGANDLFNQFQVLIFGIDPPGVPGDISTWGPPESGLWVGAWYLFWTLAPLCLAYLVFQAMRVQGSNRDKRKKHLEIAKCAGMILIGWPIAIGGLHLAHELSMALVPTGAEIVSTPGNIAKLGLGVALGAIMLLFQSGTVLTAIGVVLIERVVLIFAVAMWPVWWATKPSEGGFANTVSGIGLSMYIGVAGAKVLQSALLFVILSSEWGISGVEDAVMTLIGTVVGLLVTFIGIPVIVGRNFVPEAMTMLGTPAVTMAESRSRQARQKAGEVSKNYASSARDRASDRVAGAVPSPSSKVDGSGAGAPQNVRRNYSPAPEPGAAPAARSDPTRSVNRQKAIDEFNKSKQRRINDRLGNKGRY